MLTRELMAQAGKDGEEGDTHEGVEGGKGIGVTIKGRREEG